MFWEHPKQALGTIATNLQKLALGSGIGSVVFMNEIVIAPVPPPTAPDTLALPHSLCEFAVIKEKLGFRVPYRCLVAVIAFR